VVLGSSCGPGSVSFLPFFVRGLTRPLLYRIPGPQVLRFLVIQNWSGVVPSESAFSFRLAWMLVGGGWGSKSGPAGGRVS
jgi:hypothetical protein